MKKENKESIMQTHIDNCTSTGLSIKRYCEVNELNPSVYYYWVKRLKSNATGNFIHLSMDTSPKSGCSILFCNGHKFSFDALPPVDYLKKLLS